MSESINNTTQPIRDIMHYESEIWSVADDLLAAGIKQSDFPKYMMPFFALSMLEGRMLNAVAKVERNFGVTAQSDPEVFNECFKLEDCGYNEFLVMKGITLKDICKNDSTFERDFADYMNAFDADLKRLLGYNREKNDDEYLDMDTVVASLRNKKILQLIVDKWSRIDLSHYDNSAITTLEEHIKRKWADISASTAGEQYTPDDIISLITKLVAKKVKKSERNILHLYDPTCGGANMLFGVADRLSRDTEYKFIHTYGSEYNSTLYALAAIESRFREFSTIRYGNTLTSVPFHDRQFDVIVANPPYGTPWTGYKSEILNDQKGQFPGGIPAVSDGQMLFMQHILWQLSNEGLAFEVHNGSSLFTGDAGGGESNIRKYIFDHDWVEAIIQLPQNEFFNTGIYTYIWVMNKQKEESHRNRVALIDASGQWKLLKKAKGDKRREMTEEQQQVIVDTLLRFEESDICKIFDREHFYYNKQTVVLTEVDDKGRFVEPKTINNIKSIRLGDEVITELTDLKADDAKKLLAKLKDFDYRNGEEIIDVTLTDGTIYNYNPGRNTIVMVDQEGQHLLGEGDFIFSLGTAKGMKFVKLALQPHTTNDYEIIPHHFDEASNTAEVKAFMDRYVFKPYQLKNNTVGVELNFNKEFYVPEQLQEAEDILKEIAALNAKIKEIEL